MGDSFFVDVKSSPAEKEERRIRTSFSSIKWGDSGSSDDYEEDHGWEDEEGQSMEPDEYDDEGTTAVGKAVKFLKGKSVEPSSSPTWSIGTWYTDADDDVDYRTGWRKQCSYHLEGFTEAEEKEIYKRVTKRR